MELPDEIAIKALNSIRQDFCIPEYKEACKRGIEAIEQNAKLKEALRKIKEDVERNRLFDWISPQSLYYTVWKIIDKHTEGLL